MIVSCPSCGTRYRHRRAPGATPANARCSGCEHVFPLAPSPQSYVLMARPSDGGSAGPGLAGPVVAPGGYPAEAPPRMPIGMDDPSIAPQLEHTALTGAGASGPALTYRIEPDEVASEEIATAEAIEPTTSGAGPVAPRARRDEPGAILSTFLITVAGAAAGWWLSPRLAEMGEPRTWVLVGTTLGLLVAWLGLRWTRERP